MPEQSLGVWYGFIRGLAPGGNPTTVTIIPQGALVEMDGTFSCDVFLVPSEVRATAYKAILSASRSSNCVKNLGFEFTGIGDNRLDLRITGDNVEVSVQMVRQYGNAARSAPPGNMAIRGVTLDMNIPQTRAHIAAEAPEMKLRARPGVPFGFMSGAGWISPVDAYSAVPDGSPRYVSDVIVTTYASQVVPPKDITDLADKYTGDAVSIYRLWRPLKESAPDMAGMLSALIRTYGEPSIRLDGVMGYGSHADDTLLQWHFAPDGRQLFDEEANGCRTERNRRDTRRIQLSDAGQMRVNGTKFTVNVVPGCGVSMIALVDSDAGGVLDKMHLSLFDHGRYEKDFLFQKTIPLADRLEALLDARAKSKGNEPKL